MSEKGRSHLAFLFINFQPMPWTLQVTQNFVSVDDILSSCLHFECPALE